MDDIRQAFARANNVGASLVSFNSDGSCPNCNGLGVVYADLAFMESMSSVCEICLGPEGGSAGGEVLFEGPPQALKDCTRSLTARFI